MVKSGTCKDKEVWVFFNGRLNTEWGRAAPTPLSRRLCGGLAHVARLRAAPGLPRDVAISDGIGGAAGRCGTRGMHNVATKQLAAAIRT
jgi:hypothetical protein